MAKTRVFELISAPWTRARLVTLFVTVSARNPAQCLEADRPSPVRLFLFSKDSPLSNKRLRLLGIDTKTDHCAQGFRTTFSILSHHEETKDAKTWVGDVVELQLAHLDNPQFNYHPNPICPL
jgi:hypothetical protein